MRVKLLRPPVFEPQTIWLVSIDRVRLGICRSGEWCVDMAGESKVLSRPDDMMPLLPLLEIGRGAFLEYLQGTVTMYTDLSEMVRSFPDVLLLRFAFESSVSDYWPLKGLDWLDADPAIIPKVHESLLAMLSQPWVSQQLKQRAEKVVRGVSHRKA